MRELSAERKAEKKAEIKKSIIANLKELIGPAIIALIVVALFFVIKLYKNENQPEEIIQLNGFTGDSEEYVLENDYLKFTMNSDTTLFTVTDKSTGHVWSAVPEGAATDPAASNDLQKEQMQSTFLLVYSDSTGVEGAYNTFKHSITNKIFEYERGEDYITVKYSAGVVEQEFVYPPVLTQERYDEYKATFDPKDFQKISQFFIKQDPAKIKDEAKFERYPALNDGVIYVMINEGKGVKKELQRIFALYDYPYEQYLIDKEMDTATKSTDKPVINFSVTYRLDGRDLVVDVPFDQIEYPEDHPLYQMTVLPYFGSVDNQQDGFMLVPEGSGAIIRYNNGKTQQNAYYADIYGWDMGSIRDSLIHETKVSHNVFGATQDGNSFICIIENGASYGSIEADISGKLTSYNHVDAKYTLLKRDEYQVSSRVDGKYYTYQETLPEGESITQRYRFIGSDDYVDMAKTYQEYLFEQYEGAFAKKTETEAPVVVEVIGSIDKIKQVVGVPMPVPLALTSFNETADLITELTEAGFNNMSVKLSGFFNGGVQQKILSKVNLVSKMGSKKEFNNMVSVADELGVTLYLDGITDYAKDSDWLDGFIVSRDASRFVNKEKAKLYDFYTISYKPAKDLGAYYLLKEAKRNSMIATLAKETEKLGVEMSLQDVGNVLSGDYSKKDFYSREAVLKDQIETLKTLSADRELMINTGNVYALPYASMVTNMDLDGSNYSILDAQIPFFEIALHGYVDYVGESLNLARDYDSELLKSAECGAGLSFTLMDESPFSLQTTLYYAYFGAEYDACRDKIVATYNRYNEELGHVFNQEIVDHKCIRNDLTVTTYEDGTKVYVNYNFENDAYIGILRIPARDYVVVR